MPADRLLAHHQRLRQGGVNPVVYWLVRAVLQPLMRVYFRLGREGRHNIPASGPVILAANHRSFLDPFIIAVCLRRPAYFLAKRELFSHPLVARFLNALGAIPIRRGESDEEALATAKAVLARGEAIVVFPEGKRVRSGSLARPRRGVGRLALESGAPVVPVAVLGTERSRRGWVIRPVRVRVRCGPALTFPRVDAASPRLASEVTARIWPCVELQWEYLGGLPPLRTAAVVGAGSMGTAVATLLARAGLAVQLGCRTPAQAERLTTSGVNEERLPEVGLHPGVAVRAVSEVEFTTADLVCFAVPSKGLPAAIAQVGERIRSRSAVLVLAKGLVAPLGLTPSAYVAERVRARAIGCLGGPAHAREMVEDGAAVVLGTADADLAQQLGDALTAGGLFVERTSDVTGTEIAGAAKNAAALAAAAAAPSGMNAAGAAAGRVFGELHALSVARGGRSETFGGLAGAGDLVATVMAEHSRNRRAGELLARGFTAERIASALNGTAESVDSLPLLVGALEEARIPAPATSGLLDLLEGRLRPADWVAAMRAAPGDEARRAA